MSAASRLDEEDDLTLRELGWLYGLARSRRDKQARRIANCITDGEEGTVHLAQLETSLGWMTVTVDHLAAIIVEAGGSVDRA